MCKHILHVNYADCQRIMRRDKKTFYVYAFFKGRGTLFFSDTLYPPLKKVKRFCVGFKIKMRKSF